MVARAAAHTEVPVAVGFGIGTPEQAAAAAAAAGADGVIVGSRLVRAAGEAQDPAPAIEALVREFSRRSRRRIVCDRLALSAALACRRLSVRMPRRWA